jgi:sRNA-binding regulator protein Hfq
MVNFEVKERKMKHKINIFMLNDLSIFSLVNFWEFYCIHCSKQLQHAYALL